MDRKRMPIRFPLARMKRTLALIITLIAVGVFGYTLIRAVYLAPNDGQQVPRGAQVQVGPVEEPDRLLIPTLGIDAHVQSVGITRKGNMGVPSNFTDAAWYRYGTAPGQTGSAVIDGHVDNGFALAGVFKHLGDLKPGDDVFVRTKEGNELHFKVEEIASYQITDVPLETLFARNDRPRLNLITCTGSWLSNQKTYNQRLVVYTVLVP
jgi:sortase A